RLQKQFRVSMHHCVVEESNVLNGRHNLSQNLHPFGGHRKFEKSKSRSVSPGTRQTCDESLSDWIAYVHEYRRDVFHFSFPAPKSSRTPRHQHIGRHRNQFRPIFTQQGLVTIAPPKLEIDISSPNPADRLQTRLKRIAIRAGLRIALWDNH